MVNMTLGCVRVVLKLEEFGTSVSRETQSLRARNQKGRYGCFSPFYYYIYLLNSPFYFQDGVSETGDKFNVSPLDKTCIYCNTHT